MIDTVAVLGAGNGGSTFAAHLGLKDFRVRLYEAPQFARNIEAIKQCGYIDLTGAIEGRGKVEKASCDMKEAVSGAQLIIVAVPGFAHDHIMSGVIDHLEEGQIMLFFPGNYAALRLYRMLKGKGIEKKVAVCETSSMLYACRRTGPSEVMVRAMKNQMPVGVIPSKDTKGIVERLKGVFEEFTPAQNVLGASMGNPNCMVHVPTSILNVGWIEHTKGQFDFYWEGISRSVCKVIEKLDQERVSAGEKLGVDLNTLADIFVDFYDLRAKDLHELLTTSEIHGHSNGPSDLRHRYIHEDTPFGLVPLASLARQAGEETPHIDAIIRLASTMNGVDYMREGITAEKMGLAEMNLQQISQYLEQGSI